MKITEIVGVNQPPDDQSYIESHRSGPDVVWIDMIWVPPSQRGKGTGRQYYAGWEKELPSEIKYVFVFAADTGSGPANRFWEALGFEYRWVSDDPEDLSYESRNEMVKGVNGTPTPRPVYVNPHEDED